MIEEIPFTDTRIVGMKITGKIKKDEYLRIEHVCEERLKVHPKLRIYCELHEFKGMTIPALIEDVKFGLPHLKDFEKEAVVVEEGWISKFSEMGNRIFHSVEVKHFLPEQREEAMAWIEE